MNVCVKTKLTFVYQTESFVLSFFLLLHNTLLFSIVHILTLTAYVGVQSHHGWGDVLGPRRGWDDLVEAGADQLDQARRH